MSLMQKRQTLVEKIISQHTDREVKAGEIVMVEVDKALFQDWTGPLAIKQIEELRFKELRIKQAYFFIDHSSPSSNQDIASSHIKIREFAARFGAKLHDVGDGVCHQIMAERYAACGDIIVGSDSHTDMAGALTALATGMGSTDVAIAAALGKTWLRVPETIQVRINGHLPAGVYAKDIILYLIGQITAEGADYKSLEFTGSTIETMNMSERLVLSNMAVEAGAKCGLIASDEITRAYLKAHQREEDYCQIQPDQGANYERIIDLAADKLSPMIALPHTVDNTREVSHTDCQGIRLDQVYIGSCTNGRLEDFRVAAEILKGKTVAKGVRLIITPASREVYGQLIKEGLLEIFLEAGSAINSPGCGACPGSQTGLLGNNECCLASTNRNFKGRLGNPNSYVYLASPATCAASAITGQITDPREVIK